MPAVFFLICVPWLLGANPDNQSKIEPKASSHKLLDYEQLSHAIVLDTFRAGNHDPSGLNDYYISVKLIGLIDSEEEKLLELAKKKTYTKELGQFAQMQLSSLSFLKRDEKKPISFAIHGSQIREVVAMMMTTFAVEENKVAVLALVSLFERQKKYLLLDDDLLIASLQYFPLPYTSADQKLLEDVNLMLADSLGAQGLFHVKYRSAL